MRRVRFQEKRIGILNRVSHWSNNFDGSPFVLSSLLCLPARCRIDPDVASVSPQGARDYPVPSRRDTQKALGANAFICKCDSPDELLMTIHRCLTAEEPYIANTLTLGLVCGYLIIKHAKSKEAK